MFQILRVALIVNSEEKGLSDEKHKTGVHIEVGCAH